MAHEPPLNQVLDPEAGGADEATAPGLPGLRSPAPGVAVTQALSQYGAYMIIISFFGGEVPIKQD